MSWYNGAVVTSGQGKTIRVRGKSGDFKWVVWWQPCFVLPRNQVICLEIWKLWVAPEFFHTLPSYECLQKGVWDFFILFRSWLFMKMVSVSVKKPGIFFILANNSSSKQNKKAHTLFCRRWYFLILVHDSSSKQNKHAHPLVDIGK